MAENPSKDFATLGDLINKLQVAYEQYFTGGARTEPNELLRQAEAILRTYSLPPPASPVLQFRFNSLQARFNSFRNVWERRKRQMEGTPAVKAWGVEARETPAPKAAGAARSSKAPAEKKAKGAEGFRVALSGAPIDDRQVAAIFERYVAARRSCNESVDKVRIENFKAVLNEHLQRLRQKTNCETVLVRVEVQGNKSRISAKPAD